MSIVKRRKSGDRRAHVQIHHALMDEPAFRALSATAQALYVHLKRYFNGQNNGEIYLSVRKAAALLNVSKNTASKHFRELEDKGFIVAVEVGRLGIDGAGKASKWRLTEIAFRGLPATRDFKNWQAQI